MLIRKSKHILKTMSALQPDVIQQVYFGGISSFPVTVTNNSPVKMELVIIIVDYIQNNEKIFKTETLTFNDLEPGEAITIKAPKSSRGVKIATRIHIFNSRQTDLSYSN